MPLLLLTDQAVITRLKRQLRADYPADALDWIDDLEWTEPEEVPLEKIDYDDNIFQRVRQHEQAKVASFAKRIKAGWRKPVILVDRPSMKMKAVDGHTRLSAYKTIPKPAWAWVGKAKTNKGPWDYFHRKQLQTVNSQTFDLFEFVKVVRTPAGEERYKQPIGADIDYGSLNEANRDRLDAAIDAQRQHLPDLAGVKKISVVPGLVDQGLGENGHYENGEIKIDPRIFSDESRGWYQQGEQSGYHVPTGADPVAYEIAHEVGHALADRVSERGQNPDDDLAPNTNRRDMVQALAEAYPGTKSFGTVNPDTSKISAYGGTSSDEGIAEAWVEHSLGSDPRPETVKFAERLKELAGYGEAAAPDAQRSPDELSGDKLWNSDEGTYPKKLSKAQLNAVHRAWFNENYSETAAMMRAGSDSPIGLVGKDSQGRNLHIGDTITVPFTDAEEAARPKSEFDIQGIRHYWWYDIVDERGGKIIASGRTPDQPQNVPLDPASVKLAQWNLRPEDQRDVDKLTAIINGSRPLTQDALVYRSISQPDKVFGPVGSLLGTDWADPAFTSVSANPNIGDLFGAALPGETRAFIRVHVPAGTHMLKPPREFFSDVYDQTLYDTKIREYTLAPKTAFRVTGDSQVGLIRYIDLDVVPEPDAQRDPEMLGVTKDDLANLTPQQLVDKYSHQALLNARLDIQSTYNDRSHPAVRKIRAAVVASRKAGRGAGGEPAPKPTTRPGLRTGFSHPGARVVQNARGEYNVYRGGDAYAPAVGVVFPLRVGNSTQFGWEHSGTGTRSQATYSSVEKAAAALLASYPPPRQPAPTVRPGARYGTGVRLEPRPGGNWLAYRPGVPSPIGSVFDIGGGYKWDHADTGTRGDGTYSSPEQAGRALLNFDKGARGVALDSRFGSISFYKAMSTRNQDAYRREIMAMQERQYKLIPSIVKAATIHVEPLGEKTNADYAPSVAPSVRGGRDDAMIRIAPRRLGMGKHTTSDGWYASGDGETAGQHSLAHEYGHGVHYALAFHNNTYGEGGGSTVIPTDPKLWEAISRELGVPPPRHYTYVGIEAWILQNQKVLEYAVSRYGVTGAKELLADMWAEYSTKITDPSGWQPGPVAMIYGNYARKRL